MVGRANPRIRHDKLIYRLKDVLPRPFTAKDIYNYMFDVVPKYGSGVSRIHTPMWKNLPTRSEIPRLLRYKDYLVKVSEEDEPRAYMFKDWLE